MIRVSGMVGAESAFQGANTHNHSGTAATKLSVESTMLVQALVSTGSLSSRSP